MRSGEWLADTTQALMSAGITTARLDCLILLEDVTGKDRAWLLAHPEHELQGSEIENLSTKIAQRANHMPLAYIREHAEFYGRTFAVNPHTLIPRPETEAMIDVLKTLDLLTGSQILDVGTGSGCIAITTALELPNMIVSGCDIDPECVSAAQQNAAALGANVQFFESDLLVPREAQSPIVADVILANLPYVPDNFQINTAATHEPRHALFGGSDGLDLYRRMFAQTQERSADSLKTKQSPVQPLSRQPLYVLTESLPPQHEALSAIAGAANYRLQKTNDFIQLFALAKSQ